MYSGSFNTALIYVGVDIVTLGIVCCRCVEGKTSISTKDEGKTILLVLVFRHVFCNCETVIACLTVRELLEHLRYRTVNIENLLEF